MASARYHRKSCGGHQLFHDLRITERSGIVPVTPDKQCVIFILFKKIRKILITGGLWSTERSREIEALFNQYIRPMSKGGAGLKRDSAVAKIASDLNISVVTVSVNLPYESVVYNLEHKSSNAKRCAKYRAGRKKA